MAFGAILKSHLTFEIEFFPKQGELTPGRKLGNLVKLPLGFHQKYRARSMFFRLSESRPHIVDGLEFNLEQLALVEPVETTVVLKIIEDHPGIVTPDRRIELRSTQRNLKRPLFKGEPKILVARCAAMQNLRSKAEHRERLTRAEAFHFANVLLSAENGQDYIVETIQIAYGSDYDEHKTLGEIEKIRHLFPTNCATLVEQRFCPDYCREGLRKRNTDPLLTRTTPCGVWLQRQLDHTPPEYEDLVSRIGDPNNVRQCFFQLKIYHEHEDSLFFDPFDFELFEKDLHWNCEIIASLFRTGSIPPLTGYLAVEIPKKLDDEYHLVYRKMAYSTVYDQVPIQAVFNIVAPLIEDTFLDCSYGYRWNSDERNPNLIFDDWREAYPRFRGHILAALKDNPNGFHMKWLRLSRQKMGFNKVDCGYLFWGVFQGG